MIRHNNTTKSNKSFSQTTINAVWQKGQKVPGRDADLYRKDSCDAPIKKSDYGNTDSKEGWEVDHILPVALGGTDDLDNLQPLQWENNRHKADNWPKWYCKISA